MYQTRGDAYQDARNRSLTCNTVMLKRVDSAIACNVLSLFPTTVDLTRTLNPRVS